jgi:hypothetical protein
MNNYDTINETKKILGQFYTTNYKSILQNMCVPEGITDIIEPFAGNGDLLNFLEKKNYNIECYDIEPKKEWIIKQDTLLVPPDFSNKFVITNPPYLARNKCKNKTLFDKYKTNDLYKCFIQILIDSNCLGGILIIPLNFLCSIRKSDILLRENFLKKYTITAINIFEEQVFDDTAYSICCFQFFKCNDKYNCNNIRCFIYPSNKQINISFNTLNNFTIGGEIYSLEQNTKYKIDRATHLCKDKKYFTHILAKCIDDNIESKIGLSIVSNEEQNKYIDTTPKLTARSYAILVIEPTISEKEQTQLVVEFNKFLNTNRDKYNSLFLTNYRESNSIARKRISFGLIYGICNYLLLKS